jgi:hypothetical protein
MDKETALDELQFIRKLMSESRATVVSNGKDYIYWGILVSLGLFFMYFNFLLGFGINALYLWIVLIGSGWSYTFYEHYSKGRKRSVSTFAGKLLGAIWMSAGIAMSMFGFIATTAGALGGGYVSPAISTVLGMAYFISSYIHDEKWMIWIAILWWVGATIMFYYPGLYTMLMMGLMMIFLQVVPGILLYKKYKKEKAQ